MKWGELADGLTEDLASLNIGDIVIISEPGPGRYMQFAQRSDHLSAEVVENSWLEESERTSADGPRRIAELGWNAPDPKNGPRNWWFDLPWPATSVEYRKLVDMAVVALRDIYGIENTQDWFYRAWNDKPGSLPVELTHVRLRRDG